MTEIRAKMSNNNEFIKYMENGSNSIVRNRYLNELIPEIIDAVSKDLKAILPEEKIYSTLFCWLASADKGNSISTQRLEKIINEAVYNLESLDLPEEHQKQGKKGSRAFEAMFYSNPFALLAMLHPKLSDLGSKLALKYKGKYSKTEELVKKVDERYKLIMAQKKHKVNGFHKSKKSSHGNRGIAPPKVYRSELKIISSSRMF